MHQALLKITGRVQGVWYRGTAQEEAQKLKLQGYAKNMPDGSVEALVQGDKAHIEAFIKWAYEGPERAQVENIETSWQTPAQKHGSFEIL